MQGRQYEMAGEGGIERDRRRFRIPRFSHHDDVGVVPEGRFEGCRVGPIVGLGSPDLGLDALTQPVFDRIRDLHECLPRMFFEDAAKDRMEGCIFARPRRSGKECYSGGLIYDRPNPGEVFFRVSQDLRDDRGSGARAQKPEDHGKLPGDRGNQRKSHGDFRPSREEGEFSVVRLRH